ncbi:phosphatidylinositol N-acetylglucosaminyltransferase subunit P isoform X2 [Amaranthus tricolor]|uniref:phosphatidylinositol N-acetylglucosaminyltransferase subunit P isoform X2 n=1 Tax=Amaranthus tricolor TaxID=29722 RepID=UPI0025881759|nr:phosphatidylinositol N-acetylglucosaminyltransferase subunit P isoform X2 [Amaranthus tricolor]XP_057538294.1 phosphatidylinositol N-acetylglucosaminyltransferase subunit P isoform X2 [Amaranthus tricolor]
MEDPSPVNSPRRVLILSRKRRGPSSFHDVDDKASGFGLSGQHGPKPGEVYGFVGSITTIVATAIFFIWAYAPEHWLHSIGISYYPSRYWAVAVPTYCMVIIVLGLAFYIGLNFMTTPSPTSLNVVFDEHSRDPQIYSKLNEDDDRPIESISDLDINKINELMFGDLE